MTQLQLPVPRPEESAGIFAMGDNSNIHFTKTAKVTVQDFIRYQFSVGENIGVIKLCW